MTDQSDHDADPGDHDADRRDHDADLRDHDGPIRAITMGRFPHVDPELSMIARAEPFTTPDEPVRVEETLTMYDLHKVVESKPEGHRTRGASRPRGRGRTNILALVFAAVPLTTGACGDHCLDNVVNSSAISQAAGGAGNDVTEGTEGEPHECGSEDWETGDLPDDEETGDLPDGEATGDLPEGATTGDPDGATSSSSGASEETDEPEESLCIRTGGTESVHSCCEAVGDFPNSCGDGACGCSPEYSHQVKTCECPGGQCYHRALGCIDNPYY